MMMQSTTLIVSITASFIDEIQKFIVSIATNCASPHCSRTAFCSDGRIFARNSSLAEREFSLSFGANVSNTFNCVSSVWAVFIS